MTFGGGTGSLESALEKSVALSLSQLGLRSLLGRRPSSLRRTPRHPVCVHNIVLPTQHEFCVSLVRVMRVAYEIAGILCPPARGNPSARAFPDAV